MDKNDIILIRYGELYLKGDNRGFFESALINNIKRALGGLSFKFARHRGRYVITEFDNDAEIIARLCKVFGIHSISPAMRCPSGAAAICEQAARIGKNFAGSFKINTHRADKKFPLTSPQVSAQAGAAVLEANPMLVVDVHEPDNIINIDIRETGESYIYTEIISGAGGLPYGTAGSGLLLLSGGLDSPVAGFLMAGRGLKINAVHYHSFPYTSEQAKQKVLDIAQKLTGFCGDINLTVVPFTKIQEELRKKTNEVYTVILMRRMMMRIAERLARLNGDGALITGESLGQVASQTLQSIQSTDAVVNLPVFRPLIGSGKDLIIDDARKIGTYDISILPYEDCCTVFVPKHPVTKPRFDIITAEEAKLDIETLITYAIDHREKIKISAE